MAETLVSPLTMSSAAETYRAREVYRYYQPRNLAADPPSDTQPSASTSPGLPSPDQNLPKLTNFNTQQSFSDTALTAFAQLIALRLDSQRAIVSLIDHENEYFLAESTSTLSLIDENGPAQNAWLSISGARVPRAASLCEQTLRLASNQDTTEENTPWFLVPDLTLDEKMSKLDCVKGPPYLRFYCGVALTSKKGINLGCVYVVDDRPRTEISLEQGQFLIRMAATVMDHLENIRAKEDIVRVTNMSQALHAFIEGDGTMDGDWQRLKRYNLPFGAGVGFHWETNKDDGTGSYVNGQKQLGSDRTHPLFAGPDMDTNNGQSPLQHTGNNQPQDARYNFNNSPWSSSSEVPQIPPLKSVYDGVEDVESGLGIGGGRDTEFSNNGFSNLLHSTFSRASNLVREGMEVDGAVFFDAPFRFYQGRSTLETDPRRLGPGAATSSSESDNEDAPSTSRPGPRPHALPQQHQQGSSYNDHNAESREGTNSSVSLGLKSDVLGFSTKDSSSWNNQTTSLAFDSIDQSLLTRLVKRYPQGELFVFDENGPVAPPRDVSPQDGSQVTINTPSLEKKLERHKARKRAEIIRLLAAFPGARQIFFVPLYDSTSGCFIGSFAWSTSATRIFTTENHLSYLVAFGHSVMSEVSRLNTLSADRAKGDFISNVSHELRSPLHGVLASIEFLADTALDGFQRNLVDTVDICGRTLLDTIEHVLDFSKIKKFGRESVQPMGVVADLDVSSVIEEVLEGVYAGFEFNGLSSQGLADTTQSRVHTRGIHMKTGNSTATSPDALQFGVSNNLLTVIIDIDFRDQWKFPTVPGTWRRLTMNIFGNALKYTHVGFIKIKLEAHSIPPLQNSMERTMVILTISDSGQGMSSEFMKNKLFMPFSQEDVTAPGTGLGMSIVKQIVDLSGGRIDIRSKLEKGTEIKLSLPLQNCLPEAELPVKLTSVFKLEDPVDAVRRRATGRTVSIRGFDNLEGKVELQKEAQASLKASIEKYVTQWFGLSIVASDKPADIIILDESAYLDSAVLKQEFRVLLILCNNSSRRDLYPSRLNPGQTVECVSKPCGPHRLAKALLNCLDTEDATPIATPEERSSIGFSPTVIDLLQGTKPQPKSLPLPIPLPIPLPLSKTNSKSSSPSGSRPPLKRMRKSALILPAHQDQSSASESTSNNNSESSSNFETPDTSTSNLGEDTAIIPILPDVPKPPPRRPKMLLVEDNPVNMMLLATYMKKNKWDFEKATNGLLALQAFEARSEGFDVIFMDVSMPTMGGYESTRRIRAIESSRRLAYERQNVLSASSPYPLHRSTSFPFQSSSSGSSNSNSPSSFFPLGLELEGKKLVLNRKALIIALTGFSSQKDQEMAFQAGMDIFMTKPVRFREVGRILEGWMRSREKERVDAVGKKEKENAGFGGDGREERRRERERGRGIEIDLSPVGEDGLGEKELVRVGEREVGSGGRSWLLTVEGERREVDEMVNGAKRSG